MKIKLDENLPETLQDVLKGLGHDADTVPSEGLGGSPDDAVWGAATRENRLLVTQDLDFSDIRKFAPGSHPGIVLVRLRTPSRSQLIRRVESAFSSCDPETWARCFVVLTDRKLRVRRPPS